MVANHAPIFPVPSPDAGVYAVASAFRGQLAAGEAGARAQMVAAYAETWAKLQGELKALQGKIEAAQAKGESVTPGWLLQEQRMGSLLGQVGVQLAGLGPLGAAQASTLQAQAAQMGVDATVGMAQAALGPAPPGASVAFDRLPREALTDLVGFTQDGSPLSALFHDLAPLGALAAKKRLLSYFAGGGDARTAAKALKEALAVSLVRAETILRTEQMRAFRAAQHRTLLHNADALGGWIWTAALQPGRTCAACWAMHGTLHELGERLAAHVRCRCVATPRTKSWEELGFPGIPDSRPPLVSGPAAFAKLPPAEQLKVLGPSKFAAFQAGKLALADLVGVKESQKWGASVYERGLQSALTGKVTPVQVSAKKAQAQAATQALLQEVAQAQAAVQQAREQAAKAQQYGQLAGALKLLAGAKRQAQAAEKQAAALSLSPALSGSAQQTLAHAAQEAAQAAQTAQLAATQAKLYQQTNNAVQGAKKAAKAIADPVAKGEYLVATFEGVLAKLEGQDAPKAQALAEKNLAAAQDALAVAQVRALVKAQKAQAKVAQEQAQAALSLAAKLEQLAAGKELLQQQADATAKAQADLKSYQAINSAIQGAKKAVKGQTDPLLKAQTLVAKLEVVLEKAQVSGVQKAVDLAQKNLHAAKASQAKALERQAAAVAVQNAKDALLSAATATATPAAYAAHVANLLTDAQAFGAHPKAIDLLTKELETAKAAAQKAAQQTATPPPPPATTPPAMDAEQTAALKAAVTKAEKALAKAEKDYAFALGHETLYGKQQAKAKLEKAQATLTQAQKALAKGAPPPVASAAKAAPVAKPVPTAAKTAAPPGDQKAYQQTNSAIQGAKQKAKKAPTPEAGAAMLVADVSAIVAKAETLGSPKALALAVKNLNAAQAQLAATGSAPPTPPPSPTPSAKPAAKAAAQAKAQAQAAVKEVDAAAIAAAAKNPQFPFPLSQLTELPQSLGGANQKRLFQAPDGSKWLFKWKEGEPFRAYVDVATAKLQAMAGLPVTDIYAVELGGVTGSIQRFREDTRPAFPKEAGPFDPTKLSEKDALALQKQAVFDWLISNQDAHHENFLKVKGTGGTLLGIDKGQSFKYFGKDRLDYSYSPNAMAGLTFVHRAMERAYAKGQTVPYTTLQHSPELRAHAEALRDIPDAVYRALFREYAESLARTFNNTIPGGSADGFLDLVVARKNALVKDWQAYHAKLQKERDAALGVVPAKPATKQSLAEVRGMDAPGILRHGTNTDGAKWAAAQFPKESVGRFTPEQRETLTRYKGAAYHRINRTLRAGQTPPESAALDTALRLHRLPTDLLVHRGVDIDAFHALGDPETWKGKVFQDKGYMSVSVGAASAFKGKLVQVEIVAKAGTPTYYMEHLTAMGERELLLPRGVTLLIHEARYSRGTWRVKAEMIGHDGG